MNRAWGWGVATLAVLATATTAQAGGDPLAPKDQQDNIALSFTRGKVVTPQMLSDAGRIQQQEDAERLKLKVTDPERQPDPNPCDIPYCVGDPRIESWNGIVKPVLFTARDGATLSGHVWATKNGPAKRPGVIITNGSIIGFERSYWWAAQLLAKDGYVVLTFDAQGEGMSDQRGAAPDENESLIAGTPPIGDGGPFYDGTQDALNFFLSAADNPYKPVPSRTSGTSHDDKQQRRVKAGLNAAYNPLASMLDPGKIGLTGHSYGAVGSSYLAQSDPRVKAEVAWDTLCEPVNSTQLEAADAFQPGVEKFGGIALPTAFSSLPQQCFGAPPGYAPDVKIRTPALGLSADYFSPRPYGTGPDKTFKSAVSKYYSDAGVDSGNVVVRGGNHLEWSFDPAPIGTLRGIDMSAWYTAAWFDKYLKADPTADSRLMTDRWRDDAQTKDSDPGKDPNAISRLYLSRMDIASGGKRAVCEDLRTGCAGQVPAAQDCGAENFGYVAVDTAPDDGRNPLLSACPASAPAAASKVCTTKRTVSIRLPAAIRRHGVKRIRARSSSAKILLTRRKGSRVKVAFRGRGLPRGSQVTLRLRVTGRDRKTRTVTRRYRLCVAGGKKTK